MRLLTRAKLSIECGDDKTVLTAAAGTRLEELSGDDRDRRGDVARSTHDGLDALEVLDGGDTVELPVQGSARGSSRSCSSPSSPAPAAESCG